MSLLVPMDVILRRLHDSAFFHAAGSWLPERRIMFRYSSRYLHAVRIASLGFAALFIAAVAAPIQASGVSNLSDESQLRADPQFRSSQEPESSQDDTIRVPIWIPGFDDVDPEFSCSSKSAPYLSVKLSSDHARVEKLSGVDSCGGIFRMLPWISQPAPVGPVQFFQPMV